MNRLNFKILVVGIMLSSSAYMTSCKSKPKNAETTADTTTAMAPAPAAPVVIAADDSLTVGVKDAVKNNPGINAAVDNGVITLTGELQRSKLQGLMQTLNSLRPKKIVNQLTIK